MKIPNTRPLTKDIRRDCSWWHFNIRKKWTEILTHGRNKCDGGIWDINGFKYNNSLLLQF